MSLFDTSGVAVPMVAASAEPNHGVAGSLPRRDRRSPQGSRAHAADGRRPLRRLALLSALRELARLELPAPWVVPHMLQLLQAAVPFGQCWAQEATSQPSCLDRVLAGRNWWSAAALAAPSQATVRAGGRAFLFGREDGSFSRQEVLLLQDGCASVADVLARARALPGGEDMDLVDGAGAYLMADAVGQLQALSADPGVLSRVARHFEIPVAPASAAQEALSVAQALLLHLGEPAPHAPRSALLCGRWGAYRVDRELLSPCTPGGGGQPVLLHIVERVPRVLKAMANPLVLKLSAREVEAYRCVLQGLRQGEIARKMGVAPSTIRTTLRSLYLRLGVGSRSQLLGQAE